MSSTTHTMEDTTLPHSDEHEPRTPAQQPLPLTDPSSKLRPMLG